MWQELRVLLRKEIMLEWKQKYAFNGLLLYVLSMSIVIALVFRDELNPSNWNLLLWLMLLFAAINAVAKSFLSEKPEQLRYLYTLARPAAIILAKFIYNAGLLALVALLSLGVFAFLGEQHFHDPLAYVGLVLLGSLSLAANLTLVTAISAKAQNQSTLLAVLSFPLIVPLLLMLVRLSDTALTGTGANQGEGFLGFLLVLTVILVGVSVILFPFLWRE
ncbi:MAG: heme exporter protein CcmB [Bacteroidota bacterium]